MSERIEQDRIALLTGANNGIGLELTRRLLSEGWQVIALVRSGFPEDDMQINQALNIKQLRIYKAELTDFSSLRAALNQIKAEEDKIDVLFNNAGGSFPDLRFSKQGRESHFELQTVVPYIIVEELKELLHRGTLKTIINTSTNAFKFLKQFDPDTLEHPTEFKKLFGPYAASKLALSLWTLEIAPLLASEGLKIRSADPGGNNTLRKNKKSGLPFYMKPIMKLAFPPPSKGATLLYEAAFGKNRELSGVFLIKGEVSDLKFINLGSKVLEKVSSIYKREFDVGSPSMP
ncbi:SDR family NAD(P)-dependent oxidoreductase [Paenibacillus wynnii]|uniref:SDR family NAD(P)-dependent oxidoreductase n=1 Tax=Paenibacillus wynnii TaxID=268407 RepID=UPI00278E0B41|nr:SDR family NAD(P)-dependent oxidoreductase [Paenibacillus wynnii]MDQ0195319.1 NAD(P)-dependent dehydrogenase (short-subunit alcohol dehydrogenase family) [Paenibacillus wynnii]